MINIRRSRQCIFFNLTIAFIFLFSIFSNINLRKIEAIAQKENIVILLDVSKSMEESDTNKLALVAGQLLLDSVDEENTNISIVTFAGEVYKNKTLKDKPTITELKDYLSTIKYDKYNTNLNKGLEEALNQLQGVEGKKRIIVLSDGKEEPIGGLIPEEHRKELEVLLVKARENSVIINTIGFTEEADKENLTNISNSTNGDFLYAENTEDLFRCFNNMVSNNDDVFVIEDYRTNAKKKNRFKISSYVEEIIIKVASCDKNPPNLEVKINGENISPNKGKIGDMHRIYNIKNSKDSEVEIIADGDTNAAVIIEIKSKVKINVDDFSRRIDIPKSVPMELNITVEEEGKIIEGLSIEKIKRNGQRENLESESNNLFKDKYITDTEGEEQVKYIAKDSLARIVAGAECKIVTNSLPGYTYGEIPSVIMQGEHLKVDIKGVSDNTLENINATLIIDLNGNIQEVPLTSKEDRLYLDYEINTLGEFEYRVKIDGKVNGEDFEYQLPKKKIKVSDKANLDIILADDKLNKIKLGESKEITLSLKNVVLYGEEKVEIYDSYNNKIGEFNISGNDDKEIKVGITPVIQEENIILKFKTSNKVNITSEITTNLVTMTPVKFIWDKIDIIVIPLAILLTLFLTLFLLGTIIFKNKIISFTKNILLSLEVDGYKKGLSLDLKQNKNRKVIYSYEERELYDLEKIAIDEDDIDGIEVLSFRLLDKYKGLPSFIKGIMWIFIKENIFETKYKFIGNGEVRHKGKEIRKTGLFKKGIIISLLVDDEDENITIEFK